MEPGGRPRWIHRLATRLTLWYGLILVFVIALAMATFYGAMLTAMRRHADEQFNGYAAEVGELLREGGVPAVEKEFARLARISGSGDLFLVLRGADGRVAAASDLSEWRLFPTGWPDAKGEAPSFDYRSGPDGHDRVRVARIPLRGGFVLEGGLSTQADFHVIRNTRVGIPIILACVAALAMAFGLAMARRAIADMMRVTSAAAEIARGADLHLRVPLPARPDEALWQARTFNAMLDRIERIVGDMRQTNDNIAHELRSPLACIRGAAESALLAPHTAEEYQATLASTVEECDRMLEIVNTLLAIADANAGVGMGGMEDLDLAQLAKWGCDLFAPVAEEKGVSIRLAAAAAPIRGDGDRLRRCVANLLDNAIKYAPDGSEIRVEIASDPAARLSISNACRPLAAEDWPRLFNRFFRGQNAKGRPGTGLGLSLARSIARAHGGDLLASAAPGGEGVTFSLTLPSRD